MEKQNKEKNDFLEKTKKQEQKNLLANQKFKNEILGLKEENQKFRTQMNELQKLKVENEKLKKEKPVCSNIFSFSYFIFDSFCFITLFSFCFLYFMLSHVFRSLLIQKS